MRWYWNTYWGALWFGVRTGWNTFTFVLRIEHAIKSYRGAQRGKDEPRLPQPVTTPKWCPHGNDWDECPVCRH